MPTLRTTPIPLSDGKPRKVKLDATTAPAAPSAITVPPTGPEFNKAMADLADTDPEVAMKLGALATLATGGDAAASLKKLNLSATDAADLVAKLQTGRPSQLRVVRDADGKTFVVLQQ